jgi:hypothetical protein
MLRLLQVYLLSLGKYYKNETFALENGTQLFISASDLQRSQNFEHKVKMVSNNGGIGCFYVKEGRTTRFRSNYHPELSEGYVKYQFNTETP